MNKVSSAASTIQRKVKSLQKKKKAATKIQSIIKGVQTRRKIKEQKLNIERKNIWGKSFYFDYRLESLLNLYNYDCNLIVHIGTNKSIDRFQHIKYDLSKNNKPTIILFIYPFEYMKNSKHSNWKQGRTYNGCEITTARNLSNNKKSKIHNIIQPVFHYVTIVKELGTLHYENPTTLDIILYFLKNNPKENITIFNNYISKKPYGSYNKIYKYNNNLDKLTPTDKKLINNLYIISKKIIKNNGKVAFINESIFGLKGCFGHLKVNSCFSQIPFLLSIILELQKLARNNVYLYERNFTTNNFHKYHNKLDILTDDLLSFIYNNRQFTKFKINNTENLFYINFRNNYK